MVLYEKSQSENQIEPNRLTTQPESEVREANFTRKKLLGTSQ